MKKLEHLAAKKPDIFFSRGGVPNLKLIIDLHLSDEHKHKTLFCSCCSVSDECLNLYTL